MTTGSTATTSVRIFSVNYWPEPTGIGPYVTELAEHLVASGFDVEVVTAHPHYPAWQHHSSYDGKGLVSESHNGVQIHRVPVTLPTKMNLLGRARFELSYLRRAWWLERRLDARDVTIGYSPGLTSGLMAMISGKKNGGHRLVVQDLAGKGIEQSDLTSVRLIVNMVRSIESKAALSADRVVAISPAFVEPLVAEGVDRERITVLNNWQKSDSGPPDPSTIARYRALLAPNDETLVIHAGSIGAKQGLEQLIEAAAASTDDRVRFVLVGDGAERAKLEELAAPIQAISFVDPVPSCDLSSMLAAADILVVCQSRKNVDMSFPSKLGSYFSAGVPVLACVPLHGSVANYLEQTGAGLVVDTQSPLEILTAIETLNGNPEQRALLIDSSRRALSDWKADGLLEAWTDALIGTQQVNPTMHG